MTDYLSKKIRILSFFAILLVLLQHAINFTGYIDPKTIYIGHADINTFIQYLIGYGIARPAVFLFFSLSGFLFFRNFVLNKTIEKYISRFRTLVIPYLTWNTLALIFIIGLQLIPTIQKNISSFYTGFLPGRTIREYIQSIINHGVAFQLWFLYDLILYTAFAPLIYLIIRYGSFIVLFPFFILWLFNIPMPAYLSFIGRGGLFYCIGAYIAMHPLSISTVQTKKLFPVVSMVWIITLLVKFYIAFIPSGLTQYLAILDNTAIVFGLVTIWFGYDQFESTKIVHWLSTQTMFTFFVYASHEPLLELLKYVSITILGINPLSLLISYISVPIVTYICCISLAKLLKHYTHTIYAILTGGR